MNIDIASASKKFKNGLNIENWLTNSGNGSDLSNTNYFDPFNVQFIKDSNQIKKLMKANSWANIDLESFNKILNFFDTCVEIQDKDVINDLAIEGHNILKSYQSIIKKKLVEKSLQKDVFDYIITPIIIRSFQEFYLHQYNNSMPIDFSSNLLKILNNGYLPCGWKTLKEQCEKDYNPITYIEDSFVESSNKSLQSFDYTSGILYLF